MTRPTTCQWLQDSLALEVLAGAFDMPRGSLARAVLAAFVEAAGRLPPRVYCHARILRRFERAGAGRIQPADGGRARWNAPGAV